MPFDLTLKTKLCNAANIVFNAYLAIEFANKKQIIPVSPSSASTSTRTRMPKNNSLLEYIDDLINSDKTQGEFQLDDISYQVTLKKIKNDHGDSTWSIKLTNKSASHPASKILAPDIKLPKEYTNKEIAQLLASQNLFVSKNKKGELYFGANVISNDRTYSLGGSQKIDLYQTHLITLYKKIQHIQNSDDIKSILIALATGSGKTFVQALWFLTLHIAGVNGIFTLPDKLLTQFKADFKCLLPNDIVDEIAILQQGDSRENQSALTKLKCMTTEHETSSSTNASPQFIIASFERLLDEHYNDLRKLKPTNTVISVDEQHLPMQQEARHIKLKELAKYFLTMFLTATPNQETYNLAGRNPVALMSSRQKRAANQGDFPQLRQIKPASVKEKMQRTGCHTAKQKFAETYVSTFLPPQYNPAITFLEELPYLFYYRKETDKGYIRQYGSGSSDLNGSRRVENLQMPISRKMLFLVDDVNTVVNFRNFIENAKKNHNTGTKELPPGIEFRNEEKCADYIYSLGVYKNGNKSSREAVYNMLSYKYVGSGYDKSEYADFNPQSRPDLPKEFWYIDHETHGQDAYHKHKRQQFQLQMKKHLGESQDEFETPTLIKQLKYNIFHSLIEYLLTDITGLTSIELNQKRRSDFASLKQLVNQEFLKRFRGKNDQEILSYFTTKLTFDPQTNPKGIDAEGAIQVAKILLELINCYGYLQQNPYYERAHIDSFINNWPLDKKFHEYIFNNFDFIKLVQFFNVYADDHLTLFIMEGKEDAETPIKDMQPFFSIKEEKVKLYQADGTLNPKAKKRKRSAVELLDSETYEFHYTPEYRQELNKQIADNYFRYGFVGVYLSKIHHEGFNDPNLHTVVNAKTNVEDGNNNPTKVIQGIGRNRGLDPTQTPFYIEVLGKDCKPIFDPKHLDKQDDYLKEYYRAQQKYHKIFLLRLGKHVAERFIKWLDANMDASDYISPNKLQRQAFLFLSEALREINDLNDHEIKISKKQFKVIMGVIYKTLQKEINDNKKAYSLGRTGTFLGVLAYLKSKISYRLRNRKTFRQFRSKKRTLARSHKRSLAQIRQTLKSGGPQAKIDQDQVDKIIEEDLQLLYAKIIEKTTYKNLTKGFNVIQGFHEFKAKKEAGIKYLLENKFADFMNYAAHNNVNKITTKALVPFFCQWFDAESQQRILEAAANYKHWPRILLKNNALISSTLAAFENLPDDPREYSEEQVQKINAAGEAWLLLFQKVPGLLDLSSRNLVNYANLMQQAIINIDRSIDEIFIDEYATYFSSSVFLDRIHVLYKEESFDIIKGVLSNKTNSKEFAAKFFLSVKNGEDNDFLDTFNAFIKEKSDDLNAIIMIDKVIKDMEIASEEMAQIFTKVADEPEQYLRKEYFQSVADDMDKQKAGELNTLAKDKIIPVISKTIVPEHQQRVIAAANECDRWHEIFFKYAGRFEELAKLEQSGNTAELTSKSKILMAKILGELESFKLLPARFIESHTRDLEKTAQMSAEKLESSMSQIFIKAKMAAALDNGAQKLKSLFTRKGGRKKFDKKAHFKKLVINGMVDFLRKPEALMLLEPMFTNQDLIHIKKAFSDSKLSKTICTQLVTKLLAENSPDSDKIAKIFVMVVNRELCLKESEKIQTLDNAAKSAFAELGAMANDIEANSAQYIPNFANINPASYLISQPKSAINSRAREKLLPAMLKWFNNEKIAEILEKTQGYSEWPALLYKHREHIERIQTLLNEKTRGMDASDINDIAAKIDPRIRAEIQNLLLVILKDIPGLENLSLNDSIDCIDSLKNLEEHLKIALKDHAGPENNSLISKLKSYIKSEKFLDNAKKFLAARHFKEMQTILSDDSKLNKYVHKLLLHLHTAETLDFAEAFNIFKTTFARELSEDFSSLNDLVNEASEKLDEIAKDIDERAKPESYLDRRKINKLFRQQFARVVKLPQLALVIETYIGDLTSDDIYLLLLTIAKGDNPTIQAQDLSCETILELKDVAKDIVRLRKLLRNKQFDTIIKEFCEVKVDRQSKKWELGSTKIERIVPHLTDLFKEVIDCQCYFNQITQSGSIATQRSQSVPAIIKVFRSLSQEHNNSASPTLTRLQTLVDPTSERDSSDRKYRFLKGLQESFAHLSAVKALNKSKLMEDLTLVNEQIIRPLKKPSRLRRILSKLYHVIFHRTKSKSHYVEEQFLEKTVQFSKAMQQLQRLSATDVQKEQCDPDAIEPLFRFAQQDPKQKLVDDCISKLVNYLQHLIKQHEKYCERNELPIMPVYHEKYSYEYSQLMIGINPGEINEALHGTNNNPYDKKVQFLCNIGRKQKIILQLLDVLYDTSRKPSQRLRVFDAIVRNNAKDTAGNFIDIAFLFSHRNSMTFWKQTDGGKLIQELQQSLEHSSHVFQKRSLLN